VTPPDVDGVAFVFLDTLFPLVMYTFKKEFMAHFDAVGALPKECFPWIMRLSKNFAVVNLGYIS
jgi:hypothetical protein